MSAMSAQSGQPGLQNQRLSPFKQAPDRNVYGSNNRSQQFLGDDDFNDRVEFDRSIRVVSSGKGAS